MYLFSMPRKQRKSLARSCFRRLGGRREDGGSPLIVLSPPRSGALCKPWKEQIIVEPLEHSEIVGGHNYCRNPAGEEQMEEPWCFTTDRSNPKQVRKIPTPFTLLAGLSDAYFLSPCASQKASIHIPIHNPYLLCGSSPTLPSVFLPSP